MSPPSLVQFEFNSHHAHRHHVMQDFMKLLPEYEFYRLAATALRPLSPSAYLCTIYAYQNVVCIHESAGPLLRALT